MEGAAAPAAAPAPAAESSAPADLPAAPATAAASAAAAPPGQWSATGVPMDNEARNARAAFNSQIDRKVSKVMATTGANDVQARIALDSAGWDVDRAMASLLQSAGSGRKRSAPKSFDPMAGGPQVLSGKSKKKKKSAPKSKAAPKAKPAKAAKAAPAPAPVWVGEDGGASAFDEKAGLVASLVVPLARVRRIIVDEGDVKQVKPEALVIISKATELFVESTIEDAFRYTLGAAKAGATKGRGKARGKETMAYNDLANAVAGDERLSFLADVVPPKRRVVAPADESTEQPAAAAPSPTPAAAEAPAAAKAPAAEAPAAAAAAEVSAPAAENGTAAAPASAPLLLR